MRFRFIISYSLIGISEKSEMHLGNLHDRIPDYPIEENFHRVWYSLYGEMASPDGDRVKRLDGWVCGLHAA